IREAANSLAILRDRLPRGSVGSPLARSPKLAEDTWSILHGTAYDIANRMHIGCTNRCPRGQEQYPSGNSFRHRQEQAGMRLVRSVRLHAVATGPEVFPGDYIFGPEKIDHI